MLSWYPICPHCEVDLKEDETIDINQDCLEVGEKMSGHCPKCKRNFTWRNHYTFVGFDDLKED